MHLMLCEGTQELTKRLQAADAERQNMELQRTQDLTRLGEFHALVVAEQVRFEGSSAAAPLR